MARWRFARLNGGDIHPGIFYVIDDPLIGWIGRADMADCATGPCQCDRLIGPLATKRPHITIGREGFAGRREMGHLIHMVDINRAKVKDSHWRRLALVSPAN